MDKHNTTVLAITGVLLVGLVAALVYLLNGSDGVDMDVATIPTDLVRASVIDKQEGYNQAVRSDILEGNVQRIDATGIKNSIPSVYNDSTPLIEIRTFERQLDGSVQPLHLFVLGFQPQVPPGEVLSGGGYGVDSCGLRLGLADIPDGMSHLQWDTEYVAIGTYHRPGDPNNVVRGKTDAVRFRTPSDLGPGEIHRVDLVLIDRMKEVQEAESI